MESRALYTRIIKKYKLATIEQAFILAESDGIYMYIYTSYKMERREKRNRRARDKTGRTSAGDFLSDLTHTHAHSSPRARDAAQRTSKEANGRTRSVDFSNRRRNFSYARRRRRRGEKETRARRSRD